MSKNKNVLEENDLVLEENKPVLPPVKKGKKGMRRSVPATPERLEILKRAREKALEVRRSKMPENGKSAEREEKKEKATINKKESDDKFNQIVEREIQKRMNNIHLDKINDLVEEKLKINKLTKKKKKVIIQEDTDTDSDDEEPLVITRKKKK